jgi:hypothetical protein
MSLVHCFQNNEKFTVRIRFEWRTGFTLPSSEKDNSENQGNDDDNDSNGGTHSNTNHPAIITFHYQDVLETF